ncbi:hypothetical protein [Thalassiella azotivora]
MPTRWLRRAGVAVLAAVAVAVAPATAAQADITGGVGTGSGYSVVASIVFTGDAAPGGGGTRSVSVPAKCWWTLFGGGDRPSGSDTAAVRQWVDDQYSVPHYSGADWVRLLGSRDRYEAAEQREAAGEDLAWYSLQCREGLTDLTDPDVLAVAHETITAWGSTYPVIMRLLAEGSAPPPPVVDPRDLADVARDQMVLETPVIERNPPAVAGSAQGATLVGLDTWFWVTNPAAVGGADGTRTIRAQVGPVWAEVVATSGGLRVMSPAGSADCPPEVALRAWAPGADDEAGCTVRFVRSSVGHPGGYDVQASATWAATFTTSAGQSGPLAGDTLATVVQVPVAESQSLVTGAR